jgi:hypothetical protein
MAVRSRSRGVAGARALRGERARGAGDRRHHRGHGPRELPLISPEHKPAVAAAGTGRRRRERGLRDCPGVHGAAARGCQSARRRASPAAGPRGCVLRTAAATRRLARRGALRNARTSPRGRWRPLVDVAAAGLAGAGEARARELGARRADLHAHGPGRPAPEVVRPPGGPSWAAAQGGRVARFTCRTSLRRPI